jgi:hypothetical protein
MSVARHKRVSVRLRIDPNSERGYETRTESLKQNIRNKELAAIFGERLLCREAKSMNVSSNKYLSKQSCGSASR